MAEARPLDGGSTSPNAERTVAELEFARRIAHSHQQHERRLLHHSPTDIKQAWRGRREHF
jgi:hypothetical protein